MNDQVDANDVIQHLSEQIARQAVDLAVAKALITKLQSAEQPTGS